MKATELKEQILELKRKKNAVILAHYYQEPDIQDIADYVGDSLGLSQEAAQTTADMIVFAGVHFMAETAKILNPHKKVLLPDMEAGCSLADSCPPEDFKKIRESHPDHIAITYINCSAEIKALSDIVCTSSNAVKIIKQIPEEKPILFAPDKNLGRYLQRLSGRNNMLIWDGACIVHEAFSLEKLNFLFHKFPDAIFIAHPESDARVLDKASYVGSTSGLVEFVKSSPSQVFIVATEAGILYQMQKEVPEKKLIPAPAFEDNACACSECPYMKMNTLEKLYRCLLNEKPEIILSDELMEKARKPILRMLSLS
ncbi:MAG: quinolinate synthase NadA [Candidatus Competibacteraceae bacterium]|nr:quinolinate synthase NadA [Candidatus Competibacteraceae bacterium]